MRKLSKIRRIKDLDDQLTDCLFGSIIGGISHIEARLHRLKLSGDYHYSYLEQKIGGLHINDNFVPEQRSPNYKFQARRQFEDFYIIIFFEPKRAGLPLCFIEVNPKYDMRIKKYKNFLVTLNDRLIDLKVSEIEYALDQFCEYPSTVKQLFEIECRNLYVPYTSKMMLYEHDKLSYRKNHRLNCTYHVGGTYKIYERGKDKNKEGRGWLLENTDRVRLEYTAKRRGGHLKKHGIDFLEDIIKHPRFTDINSERWNFKKFVRSQKLPKFWEGYFAKDELGTQGTFQVEHLNAKKHIKNTSQYMADISGFDGLKMMLIAAMKSFDDNWVAQRAT
jgi:hypothetical protein